MLFSMLIPVMAEDSLLENIIVTTNMPSEIKLEALDGSPEAEVNQKLIDGTDSFTIHFNSPGNYKYRVSQIPGDDEYTTYDDAVYIIYVVTFYDNDELVSALAISPEGDTDKVEKVEFNNKIAIPEFPVKINKTNIAGEELDGATIIVKGDDFEQSWVSKKRETFDIEVKPGVYTMTETVAPQGYQRIVTDMKFEVTEDGEVRLLTAIASPAGAIEYVDDIIYIRDATEEEHKTPTFPVKINKVDISSSEELDGAVIVVKGENFEKSWTSKKGETFDLMLEPGVYTMTETTAPVGYQRVVTEIVFKVHTDGSVEMLQAVAEPAGAVEYTDGVIILKDAPETSQPTMSTALKDNKGNKNITVSKNTVLVDTVSYTNLPEGKYTLVAKFIDKSTGKPVKINNEELTAITEFTASGNGDVEVTTNSFDSTSLANKSVVCFEYMYNGSRKAIPSKDDVPYLTHEDINDKDQTVVFSEIPSITKTPGVNTGDNSNFVLYISLMFFVICFYAGYYVAKKKKEQ